jgi:protein-export membrane protein SecD/preprotein translocase SecF subunit
MRVTLEPDYRKLVGQPVDAATMRLVRSVMENRVNALGLSGTEVRLKGADQLLIMLPGAKQPEDALATLVTVAQLEFRHLVDVATDNRPGRRYQLAVLPADPAPGQRRGDAATESYQFIDRHTSRRVPASQVLQGAPLILKGDALRPTSQAELQPNGTGPAVTFQFNRAGAERFGDFTAGHVGEILAIVLDGKIISAPRINDPIRGGEGLISGGFHSMTEARTLATLLNSGALPVPLVPAETQSVGATLGQESIDASIRAGLAGLGIVLLFMLGYYWLPGLVACLALVAYAAITFAIFKGGGPFPPIVLDLPGITGFILSIGMAVDGNVLIFERMKEELRAGRSLNAAVEAGFRRAFSAILDSNVTVWIISAVLIWLGTPMVKGFAITLAIGNAVAMFTAITVTRALLRVLTRTAWARNPALYAIHNSWLNLFFPAWRQGAVMRIFARRRLYLGFSAALVLVSLLFAALSPFGIGLKPGIDFTGGSVIEVAFRDPGVTRGAVVQALRSSGIRDATVRIAAAQAPPGQPGARQVPVAEIATTKLPPTKLREVRAALDRIGGGTIASMARVNSIGPSVAAEVTRNGIFAAVVASLAMLLFLACRFAIGGFANGLHFGAGAVIALFHDVIGTVGLFAVMGWLAGWQVDSLFLTACLGLLGFSVNDTIVIYDRIRENLGRRRKGEPFSAVTDRSMTESFDRSVNTSFAIILALLMMVLFGGETLRLFHVALLFGMVIGTYSSVFVASPLVALWEQAGPGRRPAARPEGAHAAPNSPAQSASAPVPAWAGSARSRSATDAEQPARAATAVIRPKRKRRP